MKLNLPFVLAHEKEISKQQLHPLRCQFLKTLWNWLLSQTPIDEKIEAKVVEVKKEVAEVVEAVKVVVKETKDVVKTVKPRKPRKPKASK